MSQTHQSANWFRQTEWTQPNYFLTTLKHIHFAHILKDFEVSFYVLPFLIEALLKSGG